MDLFCGCGGMSLGLAHALHASGFGCDIALAVDEDVDALALFKANFPKARTESRDVRLLFDGEEDAPLTRRELDLKDSLGGRIDILLGGPPCQGNSDLNNHTRRRDPRNHLYLLMARAAHVLEPDVLIIENVPAVVHDHGDVVGRTRRLLMANGFRVDDAILHLVNLGVPQLRKRHLLIASRRHILEPAKILRFLNKPLVRPRTVEWAIRDLEQGTGGMGVFDSAGMLQPQSRRRIEWLFKRRRWNLPDGERPACHAFGNHSYKSSYGRLRWTMPAQTITTGFGSMGQGRYVHPSRPRTITPHEAARLQTFPDYYDFTSIRKRITLQRTIGNAVPPLVTVRIGQLLARWYGEELSQDPSEYVFEGQR